MTRQQTLNAFAWWRDWWRALTPFERWVVEILGVIFGVSLLASAAALLW